MTTSTHMHSLRGRARILAALGVTSLALVAASPASAISRSYEPTDGDAPTPTTRTVYQTNETPPVDENGKKSCAFKKWDGGTGYYPHGTTITVTLPDGASKTMKCDDGDWVVAFQQSGGYLYEADEAYVDESRTLVLVNGDEDPTYSATGSFYAQP